MPEPTLPVAPVRADDPKKPKKDEKEEDKLNGKQANASKEKEGEGEELVSTPNCCDTRSFVDGK